jgi:prepilin-type N-terminal cleavage/methylation domain-containing protein
MNLTLPLLQHGSTRSYLAGISPGSPKSLVSGICRARVRQIPRGFTLVEIAIAIFIITLLLGSILVPLTTQVESRNYDATQRILDQARDSLLGYAAASGRFPCPASATSNGAELFFSPGGSAANGICHTSVTGAAGTNVYAGFLPAATLGFTPTDANGYALDAWGLTQNRIRYAVSYQTVNGIARPFTALPNPPTNTLGMRAAGMSNILGAGLLNVCNTATGSNSTSCAAGTTLTSNAIVVIWSVGPNAATGINPATGLYVSADELENTEAPLVFTGADRVFVMRPKSSVTASEFDDIVTWISPPMLFNRLIASGQLP